MNRVNKYIGVAILMAILGMLIIMGMSGQQATKSSLFRFAIEGAKKYQMLSEKAGFSTVQFKELRAALVLDDRNIIDVLVIDEKAIQEQHQKLTLLFLQDKVL